MMWRSCMIILIVAIICATGPSTHTYVHAFSFRSSHAKDRGGDDAHLSDDKIDFYDVLELGSKRENTTANEIRQKYRQLSRKHHPDVAYTTQDKERYSDINRAYEVLSNKRKRKMYDMRGMEGLSLLEKHARGGGAAAEINPFVRLFGMDADDGLQSPNSTVNLDINLEVAYNGGDVKVEMNKQQLCSRCRGHGVEPGTPVDKCSACHGSGSVLQQFQIGPGVHHEAHVVCPHCGGVGKRARHVCSQCHGRKVVRGNVNVHVSVSAGAPEGHEIVLEMEGNESPDRIPGDLIVKLHTKPHPRFVRRRNGLDLETTLPITLDEALLGINKTIKHLDQNEEVQVRWDTEVDGIVQFGTVMQIKGKGMSMLHVPSERGDLYVALQLSLPTSLTQAQRRAIEDML